MFITVNTMNTLELYQKTVNTISQISHKFFGSLPEFSDFMQFGEADNGENVWYVGRGNHHHTVKGCLMGVDSTMAENTKCEVYWKTKRIPFEEKYPLWEGVAHGEEIPDFVIKDTLRQYFNNGRYVLDLSDKNNPKFYRGMRKGEERYNKKMYSLTLDRCKKLVEHERETFVLTLTCNPHDYRLIPWRAWKNYWKDTSPVFRELRRKYDFQYVGVVESTKKGFPHIHILFSLPKGSIKGYEDMENKQKIKWGPLHELIKKTSKAPVFDLQVVKGKGVQWYLTKYISKFNEMSVEGITKGDTKWDNATRKWGIALLMSCLCNSRLLRCSQDVAKQVKKDRWLYREKALKLSRNEEFLGFKETLKSPVLSVRKKEKIINKKLLELEDKVDEFINLVKNGIQGQGMAGKARLLLTEICNNLPMECPAVRHSVNIGYGKWLLGFKNKVPDKLSKEQIELMKERCGKIGCSGCFYKDFVQFIKTGESEIFNPILPWDGPGSFGDRLFDGVAENDNIEWFRRLQLSLTRFKYLFTKRFYNIYEIVNTHYGDKTADEVFRNIRFIKANVSLIENYSDMADKDNAATMYYYLKDEEENFKLPWNEFLKIEKNILY